MKNMLAPVIVSGLLFPGALAFFHAHNMLRGFLPGLRFLDMGGLYLIGFASGILATLLMLRAAKLRHSGGE